MLVYLAPRSRFESGSVISQFLLHRNLGIVGCKRYKHYFSQTEMFTFNFGFPCPRGGGGSKLSRLFFYCPPPRPGLESGSGISQFLLHHKLGTFSHKHYYSQTEMFTCKVKFGYLYPRGWGQAVQVGLPCPPTVQVGLPCPPSIWVMQCHQSIIIAP